MVRMELMSIGKFAKLVLVVDKSNPIRD